MTKPDPSKTINLLMFIALLLVCGAFGLFIILNWKYIADPDLHFRNVISEAIFISGKGELAIMRDWGFYYPWSVVGFLIYLQAIMTILLLVKKNLDFSSRQWIVLISSLILIMFLPTVFKFLSDVVNAKILNNFGSDLNDILVMGMMIFTIILSVSSIILFLLKRFKGYRKFLVLTFSTVILNVIFLFSFMQLFFD